MKLEPWTSKTIKPGQKYERLTVLSTHKIKGTYRYVAKCRCDCGKENLYIRTDHLGKSVNSCGCLHKERVTIHGATQHPLWPVWNGMMERCYNPKNKRYHRYGARGITVCSQWHNIHSFIEDMFPSYQKGLQIDRKDNDKGYFPNNCHWITCSSQQCNRGNNIKLTYKGETKCLSEWAKITKVNYGTLWGRIVLQRLPPERAFIPPKTNINPK